jgi:predicted O-linked N-acetylglucosamine transferase (SPINDLY family)
VITCAGETFPSRVAGSLLTAMGMPELITRNLEDYYALALALGQNREKREGVRDRIIALRDTAPLFDSERFTRNLETVYEVMREKMRKEYGG